VEARIEYWRERIAEQERSGMSVGRFCQEQQIIALTVGYPLAAPPSRMHAGHNLTSSATRRVHWRVPIPALLWPVRPRFAGRCLE
jgi:hypothetical protein